MIIDNKQKTMKDYIKELCKTNESLDIAVGYFYKDGFELIKDCLKNVKIRIIMGSNTNKETAEYIKNNKLDKNIKIYNDSKSDGRFHGKGWIFNGNNPTAIVGSSNCSINGLSKNKELNITTNDLDELNKWFEETWVNKDESKPYERSLLNLVENIHESGNITEPFGLYKYQEDAVEAVTNELEKNEKCKLIMACGTGKTLVSIRIMEKIMESGVCVYFVPSISLIPQTLSQFKQNGLNKCQYHAVCSDSGAGNTKNDKKIEDDAKSDLDTQVESSTDVGKLVNAINKRKKNMPLVIFTVYNSWKVAVDGLSKVGIVPKLALYDEAHRTTGKLDGFAGDALHKLQSEKKVFMTATPRVYKNYADKNVNSMDDESTYGIVAYDLPFSEAIEKNRLVPFRIVLPKLDKSYKKDTELTKEDNLKAIWRSITHPNGVEFESKFLQRVIAFHSTIKKSKTFTEDMKNLIKGGDYNVDAKHVDSKMTAMARKEEIKWLDESAENDKECRILSNARCLQEGVDVPALDAVAFMDPKKSSVDIIQAIGRAMRKDDNKSHGYIMLPVPTFSGSDPEKQMRKDPSYKMISDVMSAMLAHDNRLVGLLNQSYLRSKSGRGKTKKEIETTEAFDDRMKSMMPNADEESIKIVKTVMVDLIDKTYYQRYGKLLGEKAAELESKLKIADKEIESFHESLKSLINNSVTLNDAKKALCQHAVLNPVFNELFPQSKINNPLSAEFDNMVGKLNIDLLEMQYIYDSIKKELQDMDDPVVKQEFIRTLYDSFMGGNDGKAAVKLGIVYTPTEVVDFINNSVEHVLKTEFNTSIANNNVKIMDPFAGTGIFIARLLQSEIIPNDRLYKKYKHDIRANDILLLAYYTAQANIETAYSSMMRGNKYVPFDGILFSDTFAQNPKYREEERYRTQQQNLDKTFQKMHERVISQNYSHLHVIIGNPPYGIQKITKNFIDNRIKDTYAKDAPPGGSRYLYNFYIKALRWATDRIGKSGVVSFIIPTSFITSNNMNILRKCLYQDFTDIYIFDLLGEKGIKGHGRNIFEYVGAGGGATIGVSIIIFIKNQNKQTCNIHYSSLIKCECNDNLHEKCDYSGQTKRNKVKKLWSIEGINDWKTIKPDKDNNWLNQPDPKVIEKYNFYTKIGDKKLKNKNKKNKKETANILFNDYSLGTATNRDAWAYNSSKSYLVKNMEKQIKYCNKHYKENPFPDDLKQVKWTRGSGQQYKRLGTQKFNENKIIIALYRPFFKQYLYSDKVFNEQSQVSKFYLNSFETPTILVSDKNKNQFSTFITNKNPDLNTLQPTQCFPSKTNINIRKQIKEVAPTRTLHQTPSPNSLEKNPTIVVSDKSKSEFSVFMTNMIPDLQVIFNGQCFPMKVMQT